MTAPEVIRCPHCDTLLDTPALLLAGECGCRKHGYVEGGDGDCAVCGIPVEVHYQPLTEVPPIPEPKLCARCGHDPHEGACGWRKRGHVGVQETEYFVCRCTGVAA